MHIRFQKCCICLHRPLLSGEGMHRPSVGRACAAAVARGRVCTTSRSHAGVLLQVRELLHKRIRDAYLHPQFNTDVMKPLNIEALMDQQVQNLSGGELQRVAITLALGLPADIYLIDEPSAYLDSEQRIVAAKVRCVGLGRGHSRWLLVAVWRSWAEVFLLADMLSGS